MIIKTNNTTYLLDPEAILKFTSIKTDKCVLIDKTNNSFIIDSCNVEEFTSDNSWNDEEIDGRSATGRYLRKIKKDIIRSFGDIRLESYKNSDLIYKTLSNKFVNTSAVSDVLKNALSNNMNAIFYGAGGFGKSEMCSELFNCPELKDRVFIKSLSEATTEEDLFGGINIKKLSEEGVQEFICENSFANKEIVIFEEIFDANPRVLAALKDTLTAKEVRNGNQRFPMKTKIIIGLTNKTLDEVIEDNSTEALTQRFPIAYKLEYPLTKLDIAGLVINRYPTFSDDKLAAMIESIGNEEQKHMITPRKVLEMAKYLKDLSIRKNKSYIEQITNNNLSPIIDYLKNKRNIDCAQILFDEIINIKQKIKTESITNYDTLVDINHNINIISKRIESTENIKLKALLGEIIDLTELITNNLAA